MTPGLSSLFLYQVPIFLEFLLLLEALPRPTTGQLLAQPQTVVKDKRKNKMKDNGFINELI